VPDLLPLRPRTSSMIILGFDQRARLMRWSQIGEIILATEFKSPDMFDDPSLSHTVDSSIT
jgi:hypothetical protein